MRRLLVLGGTVALLAAGAANAAGPPGKQFPFHVAVVKGKVKTYGFTVKVQLPPTMTLGPGLGPGVQGGNNARAPKGVQAVAAIKSTGKNRWEVMVVVDGRKAAAAGTVAGVVSLTGPLAGVPATDTRDPKACDFSANTQEGIGWALYVLIGPSEGGVRLRQLTETGCR
jgi:hypothetical protein